MTNKTQLYLTAVVNSIKMSQVFESELERRHKRIKEMEKEALKERKRFARTSIPSFLQNKHSKFNQQHKHRLSVLKQSKRRRN